MADIAIHLNSVIVATSEKQAIQESTEVPGAGPLRGRVGLDLADPDKNIRRRSCEPEVILPATRVIRGANGNGGCQRGEDVICNPAVQLALRGLLRLETLSRNSET